MAASGVNHNIPSESARLHNEEAEEARKKGNEFFRKKQFFEALTHYNESLLLTELNTPDAALAYANRSAVYFQVKHYKFCLENIDLARESGYPDHLMSKLNEREEKCKKLMAGHQPDPKDDPSNFFKLSYPANEKFPFIVDCLELRQDEKSGPGIYTTRDLNPGDIIAIEDPMFKMIFPGAAKFRCFYCLKSNKMNLIAVNNHCMFCPTECMEARFKLFEMFGSGPSSKIIYDALEMCGGDFNKLEKLMDEPDLDKKTIFDYDFTTNDPTNYLRALLGGYMKKYKSNFGETFDEELRDPQFLKRFSTEKEKRIACKFLQKIKGVWGESLEHSTLKDHKVCFCVLLIKPLFDHSCSENIYMFEFDGKVAYYVMDFIPKGQRLYMTFGTTMLVPKFKRQEYLRNVRGINCFCVACKGDWPTVTEDDILYVRTMNVPHLLEAAKMNNKEREDKLKKTCKELLTLQRNRPDSRPTKEELGLQTRILLLLPMIVKAEPYMF